MWWCLQCSMPLNMQRVSRLSCCSGLSEAHKAWCLARHCIFQTLIFKAILQKQNELPQPALPGWCLARSKLSNVGLQIIQFQQTSPKLLWLIMMQASKAQLAQQASIQSAQLDQRASELKTTKAALAVAREQLTQHSSRHASELSQKDAELRHAQSALTTAQAHSTHLQVVPPTLQLSLQMLTA